MKILLTGGAGFIGSAVVRQLIRETDSEVVNVDKLTYAGNLASLAEARDDPRHHFEQVDICDDFRGRPGLRGAPPRRRHAPGGRVARRPLDRRPRRVHPGPTSSGPSPCSTPPRPTGPKLDGAAQASAFRFHHISTDEVYGSLGATGYFTEETPYDPRSPYSASKASSDHLVRAWHHTYGLPTLVTNCSNNYGPYHFPEKLIPLVILNAKAGKPLPIYGKGDNVRDWLFVDDHARALRLVLEKGKPGETYNIGGHNERTNLEVVQDICRLLDELQPGSPHAPHADLITFVADRPGHDARYAIDASKIEQRAGLDGRSRPSRQACGGRSPGTSRMKNGAATSSPAAISQERLGLGARS